MTRFESFAAADPADVRVSRVAVPGTDSYVTFTRSSDGATLLQIAAEGRVYFETTADGWTRSDCGLTRTRERRTQDEILRDVVTPFGDWQERYAFDPDGKPEHIDGVTVHRDEQGRVTACLGDAPLADHAWTYAYSGDSLSAITGPHGVRHLSRQGGGQVIAMRSNGQSQRFAYDSRGHMRGPKPLSAQTHHRDDAGRIWTVTTPSGQVLQTYLWDGWRCIGRIDGPPGAPLAAVFSLDPTATPVRVISAQGVTRIPRDAFGEGLLQHPGTPGLYGAYQAAGLHHLPYRMLSPVLACFTAPDPFDGSEDDPRRGPDGAYEGDLDVETDRQRPYDVCRNDPVGRADPSGGISAGLLISSLTWSFQNNLLSFFGIDWWFNLFGSLFTGSDFFSSDGLVSSKHIGAFGVRRDGVIPKITQGRAFTTQHIVWDTAENFDELNDAMVIDPQGSFDPPLMGGPLSARPEGHTPFLIRGQPTSDQINWHRHGGIGAPSFPGASQPVFPDGGFHLTTVLEDVRGPMPCTLTELIPGAGLSNATADDTATQQLFRANEPTGTLASLAVMNPGDIVLLQAATGERFRTALRTFQRINPTDPPNRRVDFTVEDHVPDIIGPDTITMTHFGTASTSEEAADPGPGIQGFSARGLVQTYPSNDLLELRSAAGGDDVTHCFATGSEAQLPLNAAAPGGMTAPISVIETTLAPPVPVTLDGTDGIEFATAALAPAAGIIGLVSDGTTHIPVRITDDSATPILRTDATLSGLGTPLTFQRVTAAGLLGRRADPVESASEITYVPSIPGRAPDGSDGPVVVLLSGSGGLPDAPRLVTGPPNYDAILTDVPINAGAAPWTVERFPAQAAPNAIPNISTFEAIGVTAGDPAALADAQAVRILSLEGTGDVPLPNPVAAINTVAMTDATGAATVAIADLRNVPNVHDVVALRQGSNDTLASIATLRMRFDCDRPVPLVADRDSFVVRLRAVGFAWEATRVDTDVVTVTPVVGGIRSQFPRFRDGAAVRVAWESGGTPALEIYRISAIEGLTITLDGPNPIPAGIDAGTLTVQLLEADDPRSGNQKIAVDLTRPDGAADTVVSAAFRDATDLGQITNAAGDVIAGGELGFGLVSGGVTTPVVIQATAREVALTFTPDPGLTGTVAVHPLNVLQAYELPVTGALSEPFMLVDSQTSLEVVRLQPFVPSDHVAADGVLHPGSVIIPEEEDVEVSRRQALVDHELAHTEHYHKFGPVWFCFFPLFLTELPVELATDLDQPNFGPALPGSLNRVGARVTVDVRGDIDVSAGDNVQLMQGGDHEQLTVNAVDGATLTLRGTSNLRAGELEIRKVHDENPWSEVLLSIGRVTTHGGLLNTAVGFTWGGLLWLLSKGIYGAIRAMGGKGDQYPGTVASNGTVIDLTDDEGRRELNADGQFIIKKDGAGVVRTARRVDNQLRLDQPISLTGSVQVSAYAALDPGSAFDWLQYHPGTIDANNPSAIELPGKGSDFTVGDRVEYSYLGRSGRSHISGITGDRIELEDIIDVSGTERSIRVALLAEAGTTLANADEAALNWMGMGWMRVLFDPYGQIEARVRPEETWSVVLLRIMRVILGSRNWSSVLPLFLGYVWHARLFEFLPWCPPEHRSFIEQDASEKSGDLYSPMSRLVGEVRRNDRYANTEMAVGDVARYRFWPWTTNRSLTAIGNTADGRAMGAPGLHINTRDNLRVIINRTTGTVGGMPNQRTISDQTGSYPPATALPDVFYSKNPDATLGAQTDLADIGLEPSDMGAVPMSSTLVRNPSAYVAFCRPGRHRATIANIGSRSLAAGLAAGDGITEAFDAQLNDRQNIWFNVTARDVDVTINGAAVAEGDAITLVQTQTANISVATTGAVPDVARSFRASISRPTTSTTLRAPAALRLVAQGANTTDPEPVEISRFYDFDETSGTYTDPSMAAYGRHLGGDLDIPVRGFSINITDVLTLHDAGEPDATEVTSLVQGARAFVLIPTSADEVLGYTINGAPNTPTDPVLLFETVTASPTARAAIGPLGQVRCVRFAEALPVPVTANIDIAIPVTGEDGTTGTLRLSFDLEPPPDP